VTRKLSVAVALRRARHLIEGRMNEELGAHSHVSSAALEELEGKLEEFLSASLDMHDGDVEAAKEELRAEVEGYLEGWPNRAVPYTGRVTSLDESTTPALTQDEVALFCLIAEKLNNGEWPKKPSDLKNQRFLVRKFRSNKEPMIKIRTTYESAILTPGELGVINWGPQQAFDYLLSIGAETFKEPSRAKFATGYDGWAWPLR